MQQRIKYACEKQTHKELFHHSKEYIKPFKKQLFTWVQRNNHIHKEDLKVSKNVNI